MSRICAVTKKKPLVGNTVSHANNKNKRRLLPNLQSRRYWSETEKRFIRLRVTTRAMKTIDKLGLDIVMTKIRSDAKSEHKNAHIRHSNRTKKKANKNLSKQ